MPALLERLATCHFPGEPRDESVSPGNASIRPKALRIWYRSENGDSDVAAPDRHALSIGLRDSQMASLSRAGLAHLVERQTELREPRPHALQESRGITLVLEATTASSALGVVASPLLLGIEDLLGSLAVRAQVVS